MREFGTKVRTKEKMSNVVERRGESADKSESTTTSNLVNMSATVRTRKMANARERA